MKQEELREKIAKIVFGDDTHQIAWGDSDAVRKHCLEDADHILTLVKEAGYKSREEVRKSEFIWQQQIENARDGYVKLAEPNYDLKKWGDDGTGKRFPPNDQMLDD